MIISYVVAIGNENQLGLNNDLPWRLKNDLKRFKDLTMDKYILMGQKTFMSLPVVLKNRKLLILSQRYFNEFLKTKEEDFTQEQKSFNDQIQKFDGKVEMHFLPTVDKTLEFVKEVGAEELVVIGGAQIFNLFNEAGIVNKLYLTKVDYSGPSDVKFPQMDLTGWKMSEQEFYKKDADNEYDYVYETYSKGE